MNNPKYDMGRNPVYQLNCEVQSKGRRVASTKRRVKWSFGFSDLDAIDEGKSGNECRGAEHEVVMVWSLTSGKQRVLADGIEVHFANCRLGDKFECEWTMSGGHNIKIVAHIAPPLIGSTEKFRQYDLHIDGISYWDMPKIYQLGINVNSNRNGLVRSRSTRTRNVAPSTRISPDSCHSEGDLLAHSPSFSAHQETSRVRPRRTQSMVQLNCHVPVADLLCDLTPQSSEPFSVVPLPLSSPTSVLDPFAFGPSSASQQKSKVLLDAYAHMPHARTSWHCRQPLACPDSGSVSSSSSRSIDTAPAILSPVEHALNSLINFDNTSLQTCHLQSPSSTPFDDFTYPQPQAPVQQTSFAYRLPHTVYAGQ